MSPCNKIELHDYVDLEFHRSVLAVQPHPSSEEHRRRLLRLQAVRSVQIAALAEFTTADELVAGLIANAKSGALDEPDGDALFLGLPTLLQAMPGVRAKAIELGLTLDSDEAAVEPIPIRSDKGTQCLSDRDRMEALTERQERLLDEAIEESFPASDPVSIPKLELEAE
jgi:hypothetical protein